MDTLEKAELNAGNCKVFLVTQKQKSNANNLKSEFKNLDNIEIHI